LKNKIKKIAGATKMIKQNLSLKTDKEKSGFDLK